MTRLRLLLPLVALSLAAVIALVWIGQRPSLADRTVALGFNGPAEYDTFILSSELAVRESWLPMALSPEAFAAMLSEVDFARQVLIVVAVGSYVGASRTLGLLELAFRADPLGPGGYDIAVEIGIVPESCGEISGRSYPFIVGVFDAYPNAMIMGSGFFPSPRRCGAVITATPTPTA